LLNAWRFLFRSASIKSKDEVYVYDYCCPEEVEAKVGVLSADVADGGGCLGIVEG